MGHLITTPVARPFLRLLFSISQTSGALLYRDALGVALLTAFLVFQAGSHDVYNKFSIGRIAVGVP